MGFIEETYIKKLFLYTPFDKNRDRDCSIDDKGA
jgi:hypothetical protein